MFLVYLIIGWNSLSYRWLYNATNSEKAQLKICQTILQKYLNKNTARASDQTPPMTYEECLSLIKQECQGAGISETLLNLGSCYSGKKVGVHANFESKVDRVLKHMDKEEKHKKSSPPTTPAPRSKSSGGSGRKGSKPKQNKADTDHQAEYIKKIATICAAFNNGGCEEFPCPKGFKHICSEITDKDTLRMCYKKHPKTEH